MIPSCTKNNKKNKLKTETELSGTQYFQVSTKKNLNPYLINMVQQRKITQNT